MASAATLSPSFDSPHNTNLLSLPSPTGLDNLSFDDLVEWNLNSYNQSNLNNSSNPVSPRLFNREASPSSQNARALTSPSTSTSEATPPDESAAAAASPRSSTSSEALFRHYLSIELRKIGSPVDDALLDHYVKQHGQNLNRDSSSSSNQVSPPEVGSSASSSSSAAPQQSTAFASSSSVASSAFSPLSERAQSPPELDANNGSVSGSSTCDAASPSFSRQAYSLSPKLEQLEVEIQGYDDLELDQEQALDSSKAFKISQSQDGQISHFGRQSINWGMGVGMGIEGRDGEQNLVQEAVDQEMSIDPTLVQKKPSVSSDVENTTSEEGDQDLDGDVTLVDVDGSKPSPAAVLAKNGEDQPQTTAESEASSAASTSSIVLPERPASLLSVFKPPRVGEPPLKPNYAHPSTASLFNKNKQGDDDDDEVMMAANEQPNDHDRPSKEEYAKMSSKEKRQFRNKISARNFRERRKGYIAQLEHELQERDYTIASLRAQLEGISLQNGQLRKENQTLRTAASTAAAAAVTPAQQASRSAVSRANGSSVSPAIDASITQADVQRILDALQKSTSASAPQVPASSAAEETDSSSNAAQQISASSVGAPALVRTSSTNTRPSTPSTSTNRSRALHHSSSSSSLSSTSSSTITVPNTRKDTYFSSEGASGSFWAGGRSGSLLGGGAGFMSVHTTFVPSIASLCFGSSTSDAINRDEKKSSGAGKRGTNVGGLEKLLKGLSIKPAKSTYRSSKADSQPPPPAYSETSAFSSNIMERLQPTLKFAEEEEIQSQDQPFDVYDTFASLLRQGRSNEAADVLSQGNPTPSPKEISDIPPSYQETLTLPSSEIIQSSVLEALHRAFAPSHSHASGSSLSRDGKLSTGLEREDIDMVKLRALLDGTAELVLVDRVSRIEISAEGRQPRLTVSGRSKSRVLV